MRTQNSHVIFSNDWDKCIVRLRIDFLSSVLKDAYLQVTVHLSVLTNRAAKGRMMVIIIGEWSLNRAGCCRWEILRVRKEGYLLSELFTEMRKACFLRSVLKFACLRGRFRVEVCHNCGTSLIHILKAPGNQLLWMQIALRWNYMLAGMDERLWKHFWKHF